MVTRGENVFSGSMGSPAFGIGTVRAMSVISMSSAPSADTGRAETRLAASTRASRRERVLRFMGNTSFSSVVCGGGPHFSLV